MRLDHASMASMSSAAQVEQRTERGNVLCERNFMLKIVLWPAGSCLMSMTLMTSCPSKYAECSVPSITLPEGKGAVEHFLRTGACKQGA